MQARPRLTEHGLEPVPGLPEALPSGEVLLWQGAPLWSEIAQRVFLVRWVGGYFVALFLWELMDGTLQGGMAADVIGPAMLLMLVGAVAIGILALLAKIVARTSVYSITSRRLVMRVGVALPITINIPFVAGRRIFEEPQRWRRRHHSGITAITSYFLDRPLATLWRMELWPPKTHASRYRECCCGGGNIGQCSCYFYRGRNESFSFGRRIHNAPY